MEAVLVFVGIFLALFVTLNLLDAALAKRDDKEAEKEKDNYGV